MPISLARVPNVLHSLVRSVRGTYLKRAAHVALACVPDVAVTRNIRSLGPMRSRLRRNHFFWTESFLPTHALELSTFRQFVRPGDVVYDVGANIGLYTSFLMRKLKAGHVVAFEPMHDNAELLRANVALSPDPSKGTVFEMALSDVDGEQPLQVDDVMSGSAVLDVISHGQPSAGRKLKRLPPKVEVVRVARLDTVVATSGLAAPQFMKIDTEGAAAHVVRGGRETIDQHVPLLLVALHGVEEAGPLFDELNGLGYACFGDGGDGRGWREMRSDDMPITRYTVLCGRDRATVDRQPELMRTIPAEWR